MVGFKFIFYKIEIDKYYGKLTQKLQLLLILNLNFNVPCRTSPRYGSLGSPGVRFEFISDKCCK